LEEIAGLKGISSAWKILPEFQSLQVGDTIKISPITPLRVAILDPGHALVLQARMNPYTAQVLSQETTAPETVIPPVSDILGPIAEDHPAPTPAAAERTPAMDWTWAFVLLKIGPNATRLLVRTRAAFHIPRWQAGVTPSLIELPHHVMERKMLLGIRQRVEGRKLSVPKK
jgi:hypothetical protein